MRDHGGDLDRAIRAHGGSASDWIDLSTGINRQPYPVPALSASAWTDLPTRAATDRLIAAARASYRTTAAILPVAGAQAAIQMVPRLQAPGRARVLSPTYNEHAATLVSAGWQVDAVAELSDLRGADLAVVVNPNNPDGRHHHPAALLDLGSSVGWLVVDESFADPHPELSLAAQAGAPGLLVLRSFGKFYGLAGLRLGFILGNAAEIATLADMAGPWPVSGAAIDIGAAALDDRAWAKATALRLKADSHRLDALARSCGWALAGGTTLFRLYDCGNAEAAQTRLAQGRIWTRRFPYEQGWLRIGLPGSESEWTRLAEALA